MTHLELLFYLLEDPHSAFPFRLGDGTIRMTSVSQRLTRPTVSELLSMVRSHVRYLVSFFGLQEVVLTGLNRLELGVHFPCEGLWLAPCPARLQRAREALRRFAQTRPIRKVCDLARPPGDSTRD